MLDFLKRLYFCAHIEYSMVTDGRSLCIGDPMLSLGLESPRKLFTASLLFGLMPYGFADTAATKSPAFGKGECSIAFLQYARKKPAYKVMMKDALAGYKQKIPSGPDGEVCSKELSNYLRTEADDCMVYCNPN